MSGPDPVVLTAPSGRPPGALAAVAASGLVLATCITTLFLAMRGLMDLGGFVAVGGPYEIAHPASGWVWVMPVSIVLGLVAAFGNGAAATRAHGFSLAAVAWPALFLSLGWNFLEYGVHPPGGGVAFGWLVCAAIFFALGAPVLYFEVKAAPSAVKGVGERPRRPWRAYLALNLVAVAAGITAGWAVFSALSR
jgi:hypothetical protein